MIVAAACRMPLAGFRSRQSPVTMKNGKFTRFAVANCNALGKPPAVARLTCSDVANYPATANCIISAYKSYAAYMAKKYKINSISSESLANLKFSLAREAP